MDDVVSPGDFVRMSKWFFLNGSPLASLLRRTDHLLLRACMARGQLSRNLRLSEIGVEMIENENRNGDTVTALRFTTRKGKMNKFGRIVSVGLFRHKYLDLCGISALVSHNE